LEELWNNRQLKKEDLSLIKVFGSEAWVRTEEKPKFDSRADRCLYLGVKSGVKGVKVWNWKNNMMQLARHVDFREKTFCNET
jgi:hypothetical protein